MSAQMSSQFFCIQRTAVAAAAIIMWIDLLLRQQQQC